MLDGTQLDTTTAHYLKGARLGQGAAYLIVTPRRLHHVPQIVEWCVRAEEMVDETGSPIPVLGDSRA